MIIWYISNIERHSKLSACRADMLVKEIVILMPRGETGERKR